MRESALGVANDEELARLLLTHSRKLHTILDAADRRIDEGAGIGQDDFWQQVESKDHARKVNGKVKQSRVKRSY